MTDLFHLGNACKSNQNRLKRNTLGAYVLVKIIKYSFDLNFESDAISQMYSLNLKSKHSFSIQRLQFAKPHTLQKLYDFG